MGRLFIRNIEVDMVEDVNTSLNYSLLDIQNPVNKQTNYSKSIKLPATNPINQIFEYIFNLDVTLSTFNPNKKELFTIPGAELRNILPKEWTLLDEYYCLAPVLPADSFELLMTRASEIENKYR